MSYFPVSYDNLTKKWEKVLDVEGLPSISDYHKRTTTAVLLENTTNFLRDNREESVAAVLAESGMPHNNAMGASGQSATSGNIDYVDPVLIALLRRSAPNLMAYDMVGVQPMQGPVSVIFAIRSRYENQTGAEALFNEANTAFSGIPAGANASTYDGHTGTDPNLLTANSTSWTGYTYQAGLNTQEGEQLGANSEYDIPEMSFSFERVPAIAETRKLKAEYTLELLHDLKKLHGLDAEKELANILSTELLFAINRQVIRAVNVTATIGAQKDVATNGVFDLDIDSNGRWLVEKFQGLIFQLEREANEINLATRRGKGNILLCSQDVASALMVAGKVDTAAATGKLRDEGITGNTYIGNLGQMKVHVDPYFASNDGSQYATIGYKGPTPMDAGMFYCPYVPLTQLKATDPDSFQPKIGFMTRYAMVANPFATSAASGEIKPTEKNSYYRRFKIVNIQ